MVKFLYPQYLILSFLSLPALLFYLAQLNKLKSFLEGEKAGKRYIFLLKLRSVFFCLSWIFASIALSAPTYGIQNVPIQKKGASIIFVMDISNSMTIKEDGTSRLSFSKYIADLIIKKYPEYAYALVVAKGDGVLRVPLTFENATIQENIDSLTPQDLSSAGTNLEEGLLRAATSFNKKRGNSHIVILFTDGGETFGNILNACDALYENEIRLIIVGMGSKEGGEGEVINKDKNIEKVKSALNEDLLKEMVRRCKNESLYIEGSSLSSLKELFSSLTEYKGNTEKISFREEVVNRSGEVSLLSLCFFCIGMVITYKFKFFKLIFPVLFIALFSTCNFKDVEKIEMLKGSFSWKQKNWKGAEEHFLHAKEIAQENADAAAMPYIYYAQSSTALMQNKIDLAIENLKQIENTEDAHLLSSVFYQLGIVSFMQKDYKYAMMCFKKSLEKESGNLDAKINYELSKKRLDLEIIERARQTDVNAEETQEAYNTLLDIFKRKEVEEWKEKKQSPKEEALYDY